MGIQQLSHAKQRAMPTTDCMLKTVQRSTQLQKPKLTDVCAMELTGQASSCSILKSRCPTGTRDGGPPRRMVQCKGAKTIPLQGTENCIVSCSNGIETRDRTLNCGGTFEQTHDSKTSACVVDWQVYLLNG
jgi:hypothetical protein